MATTQLAVAIRGEMKVLITDERVTKLAIKQEYLSKLIENAPASVASLARIMHVASNHDDFNLKAKGKLMLNNSFFGSMVQVTYEGCETFVRANEKCIEMQMGAERMPNKIRELLDSIDEVDLRRKIAENLGEIATSCAERAKEVTEKFGSVTALIDEIIVEFIATQHYRNFTVILEALTEGLVLLNIAKNKWADITKLFTTIMAILRADLMGDASEVRSAASSLSSVVPKKPGKTNGENVHYRC